MKSLRSFLAILTVILPLSAFALDLDSAKDQGLVGERPDGYLGAVSANPSADVAALIQDINSRRRAKYTEISKKNGQTRQVVEALAHKKVLGMMPAGHYYMDASGNWKKK